VPATRVGLISDTHGWLDPRAVTALTSAGVERILHAGDIGAGPDVLWELEAIAPVTAVLGNCDFDIPGFELERVARVRLGGLRFLVIHDFGDLGEMPDDVDLVVRGHSHVPGSQWHGRVFVVNPGSASQRRRMPSCSVAVLTVAEDGEPSFEMIELDEIGPRVR
jgi:uncharacterized protein